MSYINLCSINCAVRHSEGQNCESRSVQCPFVSCKEKIAYRNLFDHLWVTHKLLQFPATQHTGSFNIGPKSFIQNFAARPWCITFEDRQFVFEVCRKQDTGLWHFWMFMIGSAQEAHPFQVQIRLSTDHEDEILYKGSVLSIDKTFNEVFQRQEALVLPDGVVRRFVNMESMTIFYEVELRRVDKPAWQETHPRNFNYQNFSSVHDNMVPNNGYISSTLNGYHEPLSFDDRPESPSTTNSSNSSGGSSAGIGFPNKYGKMIYPNSHKLFVGNLYSECKEEILEIFGTYGTIVDVLFFNNSMPGPEKAPLYSFVVFKDEWSIRQCLEHRPIYAKDGHELVVSQK